MKIEASENTQGEHHDGGRGEDVYPPQQFQTASLGQPTLLFRPIPPFNLPRDTHGPLTLFLREMQVRTGRHTFHAPSIWAAPVIIFFT